jgi:hypothetical protein
MTISPTGKPAHAQKLHGQMTGHAEILYNRILPFLPLIRTVLTTGTPFGFHRRDPGSITGQPMWDLCWKK